MDIFEKIGKLQKGLEGTDAWAVGEQLKDICRDPECARIASEDLENENMGLKACAAKIKGYADAHRIKGAHFSFTPPKEADRIIREFYGLPGGGEVQTDQTTGENGGGNILSLEDFL